MTAVVRIPPKQIHKPHRTNFGNGWIGATDENSAGNFEWVTGEAFSYCAPATFDNQGYEDYVTVWRFGVNHPLQWNDTASNDRSRCLVEYGGEPFTVGAADSVYCVQGPCLICLSLNQRSPLFMMQRY